MTHRGVPVDPAKIKRVALMTIEGQHDDISGVGQTEAAHRLCANIPESRKAHWLQPDVGHYGVFNGSRFRAEIAPRIADFVLSHNGTPRAARARAGNGAAHKGNGAASGNGAHVANDDVPPPAALRGPSPSEV
jgi:poly(3-hydroxybutyrate) depolymerase